MKAFLFAGLFLIPLVPVSAQQKVTLRLIDRADLEEIPCNHRAIAEFRKLHPHIDIAYEPNPGRHHEEKILTALAANEPPDVFLLDSKLIPTFTNKNVLLDLTPYIGRLAIDTPQWFPNVLDIARRGQGLYWIPWVWTGGGDVGSDDGRQATGHLNSVPTETALQFLIDLRNKHRCAPDFGSGRESG